MKTYLNEINGIADAITSMYMSKRTWSRAFEENIRKTCHEVLEYDGRKRADVSQISLDQFEDWLNKLVKWGWKHTTMLRFIDLSITVEGLHRAGQDDWDAHAKRFDNRIIRSSTRLANYNYEISEWYQDKIVPTDLALKYLGLDVPEKIEIEGRVFSKGINGYIREDCVDDSDVKRGLYMLSIPSNFIFKVNLAEWAHVYKERNRNGHANPEVKECCEDIATQISDWHPQFNPDLFLAIKN